jgi:type II secretory pathway pseudopilin PulG
MSGGTIAVLAVLAVVLGVVVYSWFRREATAQERQRQLRRKMHDDDE